MQGYSSTLQREQTLQIMEILINNRAYATLTHNAQQWQDTYYATEYSKQHA